MGHLRKVLAAAGLAGVLAGGVVVTAEAVPHHVASHSAEASIIGDGGHAKPGSIIGD